VAVIVLGFVLVAAGYSSFLATVVFEALVLLLLWWDIAFHLKIDRPGRANVRFGSAESTRKG
jgi:hypothetical protein